VRHRRRFRRVLWPPILAARPKNVQLTPLLLGMTMLALALHGTELRAEQLLHRITDSLRIARR
jgi:hypothetical protein